MTGIVLTGGGSQIRNLNQLVAFITGKETRIGYPNEHLGSGSKDDVVSPMYSTGVGLVLKGFEYFDNLDSKPYEVDCNTNISSQLDSTGILDRIKEWFTEDNIN